MTFWGVRRKKGAKASLLHSKVFPRKNNPHIITHDSMAATMQPSMAASAPQPGAIKADHTTDLILQAPLAAGFAVLGTISLLQVLLPGPLSRQLSSLIRWAGRHTVVATVMATCVLGMGLAVAATGAQLRYLYLGSAPPGAVSSGAIPTKGMSAAAGMSATVGEGQKLWTTLLLGLADIVLAANIWGHARDQQQATQAMADSKAVRKQAANQVASLSGPTADDAPAGAFVTTKKIA